MIKLFEHQKIGKEYLLKMKKACLFYEIGTGKTFTALAAIQELPEKCKILIVKIYITLLVKYFFSHSQPYICYY